MEAHTDLDLLLIGKTGNGKSATGNSILKRRAFSAKASYSSVTTNICSEVSEYKGRIIKIVDGPGVGDTRLNSEGSVKLVVKAMEEAIMMNPRGYHAFLLVVRFGGRFTREDTDTIKFLKDVFGPDFVKNFCILVMTCGDSFSHEEEETGLTFPQWCSQQEGVFRELLSECAGRIILFNNVTKDEATKDAQLDKLIAMISGLASCGQRYTDRNFADAHKARERAIVEAKKPMIREGMTQEISLILQKLDKIRKEVDPQNQPKELEKLLQRTNSLLEHIKAEDKGTGAMHDLVENVEATAKAVSEAANVQNKLEADRQSLRQQEQQMRQAFEQQLEAERQAMKRQMEEERRTQEEIREREREMERRLLEREERAHREMQEREDKLRKEWAEERRKQDEHYLELERERRRIQTEADKDILGHLLGMALNFFFSPGSGGRMPGQTPPIIGNIGNTPSIREI